MSADMCTAIFTHVYEHVCRHESMCMCVDSPAHIHECLDMCIHIHVHIHVQLNVDRHVYRHVYRHV